MNKLEILKGASELVVSIGVSAIVGNAIKMTTDPNTGRFKKIAMGVGGFVLSRMVGEMATDYSSRKIDGINDAIQKVIHPQVPDELPDEDPEIPGIRSLTAEEIAEFQTKIQEDLQ